MTDAAASGQLDRVIESVAEIPDVEVARAVPAGPYCTYRVGGPLGALASVRSTAALVTLAEVLAGTDVPTIVIGRGSNLLVADAGFPGLAIHLSGSFADIDIDGTAVHAGAAVSLPVLARATVAAGLTGFEWAVGVPGTIGGAVRMNAGGHGSDMAASLRSVAMVDLHLGGVVTWPAASLQLGYRRSSIAPWQVVAEATLDLEVGDIDRGETELRAIVAWRRDNQPGGANAGSVFTNPPDDSAGRLIDASGLKGHRHGTAAVSDKHANFIQADADGSADDIVALMRHIVATVATQHGVRLSAETRLVGFAPELVDEIQPHESDVGDNGPGGA